MTKFILQLSLFNNHVILRLSVHWIVSYVTHKFHLAYNVIFSVIGVFSKSNGVFDPLKYHHPNTYPLHGAVVLPGSTAFSHERISCEGITLQSSVSNETVYLSMILAYKTKFSVAILLIGSFGFHANHFHSGITIHDETSG